MARNPFTKKSAFGMLAVLLTGILTFAVIVFVIGEGIDLSLLEPVDKMMFVALGVMLVGLWLGMLHSLSGALICLAGFGWFLSLNGAVSLGVVLYAFPVIAALHLGQALLVRTQPEEKGLTDADRRRARIRQVQQEWEEKQRALQAKKSGGKVAPAPATQPQSPPPPPTQAPPPTPRPQQPQPREQHAQPASPGQGAFPSPTASEKHTHPTTASSPSPDPEPPSDEPEPPGNSLGSPGDGRASAPLPGWVPEDERSDDDDPSPSRTSRGDGTTPR